MPPSVTALRGLHLPFHSTLPKLVTPGAVTPEPGGVGALSRGSATSRENMAAAGAAPERIGLAGAVQIGPAAAAAEGSPASQPVSDHSVGSRSTTTFKAP